MDLKQKQSRLKEIIQGWGKAAVAFSGGVDSSYLLKVSHDILRDNLIAITLDTAFFPRAEMEEACSFALRFGIRHHIIQADVFQVEELRHNPENRCYLCKKRGFSLIKQCAKELGIGVVADGTNADDAFDYRPGAKAAEELGVQNPLQQAGLTKEEIRELSKEAGLSEYQKPSNTCLATRIPYGEEITLEKLEKIERSEEFLHSLGFIQVRIRCHGNLARIELEPDMIESIAEKDLREKIAQELKKMGFTYVSLDLSGYRTGSMNATIKLSEDNLK